MQGSYQIAIWPCRLKVWLFHSTIYLTRLLSHSHNAIRDLTSTRCKRVAKASVITTHPSAQASAGASRQRVFDILGAAFRTVFSGYPAGDGIPGAANTEDSV